ncbi:MAG TPA: 2-oxo acid dehydrogenase subunit E2 [Verrucomicrobiae bacterium]|nr:2-oxo acid dehydrogenase subunit E2 [Verrucomicrobiae bacterium]
MNEVILVKVPFENVNDPTAKIVDWKVSSGSKVKQGDAVVELETTKTTFPVTTPTDGLVVYTLSEGDEVPVGGDLFRIYADELSARAAATLIKTPVAPVEIAVPGVGGPMISKRAQELMAANRLDLSVFAGMSMVKESDVREKLGAISKDKKALATPPAPPPEIPAPKKSMEELGDLIPLERSKQVENRELSAVDREVLKSTVYYFCPAVGLQESCVRQSPPVQRLVVILFELVKLLKKFPTLNAFYTEGAAFVYRHVHIGFAVDMGRGLKVLVVREAENLSFAALAEKVEDLLVKYATDSLAVKEIVGSTFTITDLAQTGVLTFEPLINSRQAAILGIGGEISPAGGFMLSCAFDHRLNSGKGVAGFLAELSARLVGHAMSLTVAAPAEQAFCSRCLQTVGELRAIQAFLVASVEPPGHICSHCFSGY